MSAGLLAADMGHDVAKLHFNNFSFELVSR
jgi:hypothetical protein